MERLLSMGAKGPDVKELQESLNASPPSAASTLATDGSFGPKTDARVREFQRFSSLKVDGIVGPQTRGRLNSYKALRTLAPWNSRGGTWRNKGLASFVPWKDTAGVLMGSRRSVQLQPVFLKAYEADVPTGFQWFTWLAVANQIWGKLGVVFIGLPPITVVHPDPVTKAKFPDDYIKSMKYYGDDSGETTVVRTLLSGWGVHVFVVDNIIKHAGGGDTFPWAQEAAKVVISDQGSPALLSHELGHVLGLDHPAQYIAQDDSKPQIMTPAGDAKGPHHKRNPLVNYYRMTWPPPSGVSVPLRPDP